MKMKAAVMEGINQLVVREIDVPEIGDEYVLVKTKACSICNSDIDELRTGVFAFMLPIALGHEVSGVVHAVGARVKTLKVGDRVALEPNMPCWKCDMCRRGFYHLCPNTDHIGCHSHGGLAEYVRIHELSCCRLPDEVGFVEAALVEPISVCLEGIRRSRLSLGEDVLVFGNGPFGQIYTQLAQIAGANEVLVAGRNPHRNELSRHTGAMVIDTRTENLVQRVMEITRGRGVDVVIDAAGSTEVLALAAEVCKARGRIVLFSHTMEPVALRVPSIQLKEIDVLGSLNSPHTFPVAVELLRKKRLDLSGIITHTLPLDDIHHGIELAEKRLENCMKAVVVFE
jgi:L-iditol 2-dehydrogenase